MSELVPIGEHAESDVVVAKLHVARRALTQARTIQESKKVADISKALGIYSRQQQLGKELEQEAKAIFLEAMRRCGEMLLETDRHEGGRPKITGSDLVPVSAPPTLKDMTLSKKESALAQKLAALPSEMFEQIKSGAIKITEAFRRILASKTEELRLVEPTGKYRVIYADPPWSYGNTMPEGTTEQRDHYPVMSLADICAEPVKNQYAEDNAVLFLWVTSPILEESFQVIEAWGFKYKASFVWDKIKHNMGHYNSVRHELLLIATRGSCQPDQRKLFDSVVSIERQEHSRKPEFFYEIIETLYPIGKRLEMYRRGAPRAGWDAYGYEAEYAAA